MKIKYNFIYLWSKFQIYRYIYINKLIFVLLYKKKNI